MNKILKDVLHPVLKDNKIFIPNGFKNVKLDVGLSMNSPNSEVWLQREENLMVFGFEPGTAAHESFTFKNKEMSEKYPQYIFINPDRINKTFFPLKCALSNGEIRKEKFYITGNDLGCSSLYEPNWFEVVDVEEVAVITLKDFFEVFPWEQINYIDHLKIDAQGSDFSILEGAGDYLNNIVFISLENTTQGQYNKEEDYYKFKNYLKKYDFELIEEEGINSTYLNTNHIDKLGSINFFTLNS
jgi:hypothetical protein